MLREALGFDPKVDAAIARAIEAIKAQGAAVVDVKVATHRKWGEAEGEVLLYEFKHGLNAYLAQSRAPHKTLEALIAWNAAHAREAMPYFGQETFEEAQKKGPLTDAAYRSAKESARWKETIARRRRLA